ncbi:LOW QUALITY PROTEIN: hypothetical protein V2J09_001428 [Rumex salicifolius]
MHEAKQCQKGRDCFNCKQSGHVAKDCPKKSKGFFQGCLKCGSHGHLMFSCTNDYCSDDLRKYNVTSARIWVIFVVPTIFGMSLPWCHAIMRHALVQMERNLLTGRQFHVSNVVKRGTSHVNAKALLRLRNGSVTRHVQGRKVSKKVKYIKVTNLRLRIQWHYQAKGKYEVDGIWMTQGTYPEEKLADLGAGILLQNQKNRTPNWSTKRQDSTSGSLRSPYERTYGNNRRPYGRTPSSQASRTSFEHGYTASRFANSSAGGLSKENQWW